MKNENKNDWGDDGDGEIAAPFVAPTVVEKIDEPTAQQTADTVTQFRKVSSQALAKQLRPPVEEPKIIEDVLPSDFPSADALWRKVSAWYYEERTKGTKAQQQAALARYNRVGQHWHSLQQIPQPPSFDANVQAKFDVDREGAHARQQSKLTELGKRFPKVANLIKTHNAK